jgi:hypothetical protein
VGQPLLGGDDDGEFPLIGENAVLMTLAMKLLEGKRFFLSSESRTASIEHDRWPNISGLQCAPESIHLPP